MIHSLILDFITENPISLLQLAVLILGYYQLRWTRLDTAHPQWEIVEVSSIFADKQDKETTVNVSIMNVGKGRAENVEYNVSIQDKDFEALENGRVPDLLSTHDEDIIYRQVVNPGETFRINFRVDRLRDVVERLSIRVKDENGRTQHLYLNKEEIIHGKNNWALKMRKQPYTALITRLRKLKQKKFSTKDAPQTIEEL